MTIFAKLACQIFIFWYWPQDTRLKYLFDDLNKQNLFFNLSFIHLVSIRLYFSVIVYLSFYLDIWLISGLLLIGQLIRFVLHCFQLFRTKQMQFHILISWELILLIDAVLLLYSNLSKNESPKLGIAIAGINLGMVILFSIVCIVQLFIKVLLALAAYKAG